MTRKIALYLDTSIPSALFQKPVERKEITNKFFNEYLPDYDLYISDLVVEEIKATPEEILRNQISDVIKDFNILTQTTKAENLANEYLKFLKIPDIDALHIAIATVEGMNYLVTWNMEHLAREKTRRVIDNVNFLYREHRLFIVTPKDLLD